MRFLETDGLKNGEIALKLRRTCGEQPEKRWLPAYYFDICLADGTRIGYCDLRVGHNDKTYIGGNIGYGIDAPYRGHRYAAQACSLLFRLARMHRMDHVIITCDPANAASARTCVLAGGRFLETAPIPEDNEMYAEGKRQVMIYRFDLARVIETQRLLLREYTQDDLEALYGILSDPETMRHYPAPYDRAKTQRWIDWNLENYGLYGFGLWAAVLKETGEFIGDCGITLQNIDGDILPEIGYHIRKDRWRQGLAKEAARAVRDWFFRNTAHDAVWSYMKYTNTASRRTAMANGMKLIKEYSNPKNTVSCAYAITREEWKALTE